MTEPLIHLDDLTQTKSTLGSYTARWEQGGVYALADLSPLRDDTRRGYVLELNAYNALQPSRPLGRKQQELATKLVTNLRELLISQLVLAGWQCEQVDGVTCWQPKRIAPIPKVQGRVLAVTATPKKRGYQRTITPQAVTVTCISCLSETERMLYPGATPLYCEQCAKRIEREKTRKRVARLRAGQKLAKVERG